MHEHMFSGFTVLMGLGFFALLAVLIFAIWSIFWKGLALWVATKEDNKPWFILLLILNTAGILEIIYLAFVSKKGKEYIADWKHARRHKTHHKKTHTETKEEKEQGDSKHIASEQ